jgi:glycosyltransferase involved in cell wall biosynthesis
VTTRAKVLEVCAYPPPRAGWSMRAEVVTKALRAAGHDCIALNTGSNRRVPSPEYETVMDPWDFVRKLWRFSRAGYTIHAHMNGDSAMGFVRTVLCEVVALVAGTRCYLTFHAGVDQSYFPKHKAPVLTPLYRLLFAIPKLIICNSQAVKDRILDYGVPAWKVVPIPAFTRQYLDFTPVTLPPHVEAFLDRTPDILFTYVRVREGFNLPTLADGFAHVAQRRAGVGLLLVGVTDDVDAALWADFEERCRRQGVWSRVCVVEDFDHDQFLTAVTRSSMFVRTPTTDGVSSSVLEAMALGVPIVAAENGTRPPGVVTFRADDPADLARQIEHVLDHHDEVVTTMPRPTIADTLSDEVAVLTGAWATP